MYVLLDEQGVVVAAHAWPMPLELLARAHGVKVSRRLSVTQDLSSGLPRYNGDRNPMREAVMAGASGVSAGDHVWANDGGTDFVGHVQKGEHENAAGELKALVQHPDGTSSLFGYRDPKDDDEHGKGGTFWLV